MDVLLNILTLNRFEALNFEKTRELINLDFFLVKIKLKNQKKALSNMSLEFYALSF